MNCPKRIAALYGATVLASLLLAGPARAEWSEPPAGTPADVWNGIRPVAGWIHRALFDRKIDLWGGVSILYRVRPAVPGGIVPTVSGR